MEWFSPIESWPTMEGIPVLLIVMDKSGNTTITKGITSRKGINGLFKITDKNLKHRKDLSVTHWAWTDD
mgnify:CR=1 FL=1